MSIIINSIIIITIIINIIIIIIIIIIYLHVGFGGLAVPCSPRYPRFVDSSPAEVNGFFQDVKILSTILREGL